MNDPKIKVTETDPGTPPLPRAAVALKAKERFSIPSLRLPRAQLIEAVRNNVKIPKVWQDVILAEIALVDQKHELLRIDLHRGPIGGGINCTFTVKEL